MLLSFAAAGYAQEVIVNGHMFTPLDAWTKWGDWNNVSDSGDTRTPDGSRCMKNKVQGNTSIPDHTDGMGAWQVVTLDLNYNYDFSGWAYLENVEKAAYRLTPGDYGAGGITNAEVIAGTGAILAQEWTDTGGWYVGCSTSFVATQAKYTVFTMVVGNADQDGKFDDISLVQGDLIPEPGSLLALSAGLPSRCHAGPVIGVVASQKPSCRFPPSNGLG